MYILNSQIHHNFTDTLKEELHNSYFNDGLSGKISFDNDETIRIEQLSKGFSQKKMTTVSVIVTLRLKPPP